MKTKLLLFTALASIFAIQTQAQDRTTINATNSEISDNLDLRAVASIFGDSRNLQDFERRLNDPKTQISNLDLNNDNQVDYLRVIETVDKRTHVIIIQAVLDRDVYQDIATIDVEKDNYNRVHVQVVGDVYMYGHNYIYEPVYYTTPFIYASFWLSNYRPYYSSWSWNYYPNYYYAWNPYPVFRYRNNISLCLNINNSYNYVNYRRSNRAINLYSSRRSNGYERQYPNYSFSRRNSSVANRYELDQRRGTRNTSNYYNGRTETQRGYSQNRGNSSREVMPKRDYSQNRGSSSREAAPQRDYSQNREKSSREVMPQRDYSQNREKSSREVMPQRDYSQNREKSSREAAPQRDYSQNRGSSSREAAPQRTESQRNSNSSREAAPQRTESQRNSSASRSNDRRS
nr:hypothetical protein [uncultured Flavobacterium sp.]